MAHPSRRFRARRSSCSSETRGVATSGSSAIRLTPPGKRGRDSQYDERYPERQPENAKVRVPPRNQECRTDQKKIEDRPFGVNPDVMLHQALDSLLLELRGIRQAQDERHPDSIQDVPERNVIENAGSRNSDRSLSGNSGRSKQALRSRSTRAKRPPNASPGRGRSDRSHDPA